MKTLNTFCRICEPLCPLLVDMDGHEIVKLRPNPAHELYRGFCCAKGLGFGDVHRDQDRLSVPLKRVNPRSELPGQFEPVSWDVALADIAERLGRVRAESPERIAVYSGNPMGFNSGLAIYLQHFLGTIGTRMTFGSVTQDVSNKFAAAGLMFGSEMLHPIPDLDHTDYLLCIGSNPKVSHFSIFHVANGFEKLRDIVARGGTVCHVNPRRSESSTPVSGETLLVKPDTDVYLLAALINEIYRAGRFDWDFIKQHSINVEGLVDFIKAYPAERVAGIIGLAPHEIVETACRFADAKGASTYMSVGGNMGRQGALTYWLLQMLTVVTGNMGRSGGNIVSRGYLPNAWGDEGTDEERIVTTPVGRYRRFAGALPGNLLADCILGEERPVRALFVLCGNPVLSIGGEEHLRRALAELDLMVSIDIYPNATSEHADYILPGTDQFERADLNLLHNGFHLNPFAQYTDELKTPGFERREEWRILAQIEQAMGLPSMLDDERTSPFSMIDGFLRQNGLSIEALRAAPEQTIMMPPLVPAETLSRELRTAERPIDCCPTKFATAIMRAEAIFDELMAEPEDVLKLINRRTLQMHNSWMANIERTKRGANSTNPIWMNPVDAAQRFMGEGDTVSVSNAHGLINAEVRLDPTLREGVVAMSHGWGNARTPRLRVGQATPGVNVNRLLPVGPDSFDPISNQAFMTGIPVVVEHA